MLLKWQRLLFSFKMISQEGIIAKRGAELKTLLQQSFYSYTKSDNNTILIERGLM